MQLPTRGRNKAHGRRAAILWKLVGFVFFVSVLTGSGGTQAGYYTFTLIAADSDGFTGFGLPTINNKGEVAFAAVTNVWNVSSYNEGVYVGNGASLKTVAATNDFFKSFSPMAGAIPSINDNGDVAFYSSTRAGPAGIYRQSGDTLTTIADSSNSFERLFNMRVSMNNSGAVAFAAPYKGFANIGVFVGTGGSPTLVADRNNSALNLQTAYTPAINNSGTVAFPSLIKSEAGGGQGFFKGPDLSTDTLVDSNGPVIDRVSTGRSTSINDSGTIVYVGSTTGLASEAIITSNGSTHNVIATTLNSYTRGFATSDDSYPAINNHGEVVFMAGTDSTGGLYTGPDSVRDKVIEVGDSLYGGTLSHTNFGTSYQGINDHGQIAFRGIIQQGWKQFIARADPLAGSIPLNPLLPDPGSLPGAFAFDIELTDNGLGVVDPIFVDPDAAVGYEYLVTDPADPNFTSVLLPESIGDGLYELWLWRGEEWEFDQMLSGGIAHQFLGDGVDRFRILGIEPQAMLDPSDPLAFVTGLTFASGGASVDMTMTAIVPEPASLLLLGLCLLASMGRRRTH